jgi:N-acetylmuramoyl-L-alanine amidase
MITSALLCLTLNIFHESRSESQETQEAVAMVTMNRANRNPGNICRVVYAPHMFSWTRHSNLKVKEKVAFERAKRIASEYLRGKVNSRISNRLYFNERRLGKRFRTKHRPIIIGRLIMY